MVLLQKIKKNVQKIGKDSVGLVFPKYYIFVLDWFKQNNLVDIETHKDKETNETYIIIKQSKNGEEQ